MNKIDKIKELTLLLNKARNEYYNHSESPMTDYQYDELLDELKALEKESGFLLSNSPTQTVGYTVQSKLKVVQHNHPMLSLDKTKSIIDIKKFSNNRDWLVMLKMDGLTISIEYDNGILLRAESRGNGEEGEDVTENIKTFTNIPLNIKSKKRLIIDGEAIITYESFDKINENLVEDDKYKNPRNLASGSVRQLDSEKAAKRNLQFIAWKVVEGMETDSFSKRLDFAKELGFEVVPYCVMKKEASMEEITEVFDSLKEIAKQNDFPIDGLVASYDNISYGESLGMTGHHIHSQIAFKFYDEEVETTITDIIWSMGKTGSLTPVANFTSIEIDNTTVSRASVHNISILEKLQLSIGDTVTIVKANQIIPQVKENLTRYANAIIPTTCPICGENTVIKQDNDSKVLFCSNEDCSGKLLGKLISFTSKAGMDIAGLSEATISFLVEKGWVTCYQDIFNLKQYQKIWKKEEGYGVTSVDNLLTAIENSRNVKLEKFLYSLNIQNVGRTKSKIISHYCNGDFNKFLDLIHASFDWTILDDFGDTITQSIQTFMESHESMVVQLAELMNFIIPEKRERVEKDLTGLTFVITGSLEHHENRDALKNKLESMCAKVSGFISSNTSYLINNDIDSTSGKNKKAMELNIPIISELQLLELFK